jgi:hypothetical protein
MNSSTAATAIKQRVGLVLRSLAVAYLLWKYAKRNAAAAKYE